uniref:Pyruvate decarboxylase n=1 Tax=Bionectria ochroleuca TaxID=29856 RepID=A0A8H7KB67_BIOOC
MSRFFRPGDIILTETGTSSSGGQSFVLPNNTTLINSSIWLSIGYTLAASQGASLAQREMAREGSRPDGRVILFEGDGSLQMTAQAISDIIRNRLDVVMFVLNNNGYTIERLIHGYDAGYNDIQPWRHLDAPRFFGAREDDPSYPVRTLRASNWGEMAAVLRDEEVVRGKGLVMVEVMMDMSDAPESLKKTIADVQRRNAGNRTVAEVETH